MRILLDTHVLLWAAHRPDQLNDRVREQLVAVEQQVFVSAASVWELGIKVAAGKLTLPLEPAAFVRDMRQRLSLFALPITDDDALTAAALPAHHRDPFDRMLVAQAIRHDLSLVTADSMLLAYGARAIWAGRQPP